VILAIVPEERARAPVGGVIEQIGGIPVKERVGVQEERLFEARSEQPGGLDLEAAEAEEWNTEARSDVDAPDTAECFEMRALGRGELAVARVDDFDGEGEAERT
jgi:hypothetical protein